MCLCFDKKYLFKVKFSHEICEIFKNTFFPIFKITSRQLLMSALHLKSDKYN